MNIRYARLLVVPALAVLIAGCNGLRQQPGKTTATPKHKLAGAPTLSPKVKMETSLGDIVIQLDGDRAPRTVANFVRYVQDRFYDGTVFHRVIDTFTIQGGAYTPDMEKKTKGLRPPIMNESDNGLANVYGTIGMARLGGKPDSAQAEFYINVQDNMALNVRRDGAGYCVFGRVVEGMDTVEKIRTTPVGPHPKWDNGRRPHVPTTPVVIKSVRLLSPFDFNAAQLKADEDDYYRDHPGERQRDMLEERIAEVEREAGNEAVRSDTGLIYVDHRIGTGLTPGIHDVVQVHYRGALLAGGDLESTFDQPEPTSLPMDKMIPGWREGLLTMKVGGLRTLIIPPDLAFGMRGRPPVSGGPSIPPNATLVYDVELLAIE